MFRRRFLAGGLVAALSATPALAVPGLQVDITGSTYIGIDPDPNKNESFITMDDIHTVNTYLAPSGMGSPNFMTDEYFLSIALVPPVGPAGEVLGSFTVNGNTIFVTSGMTYGVPPDETMVTQDGGDLGKHGIFETYFVDVAFMFDPMQEINKVDTITDPGLDPTTAPDDVGGMFYVQFLIDATNLVAGVDLHYDLYNTKLGNQLAMGDELDIDQFAPFSHDAGTMRVPEPGTFRLLAFGLGLLALGAGLRRRERRV